MGKTTQKASAPTKGGPPKTPPKSAFAKGKFGSPLSTGSPKKDPRNLLFISGLSNGVAVAHGQKFNKEEEPFMKFDLDQLHESDELKESLGINAILYRKGVDGGTALKQAPNSDYNWRMFVLILGVEGNTSEGRREAANKLINYFNANATGENYHYPKKWKFGGDLTTSPMATVDAALLDADVAGLVHAAYPDSSTDDILGWDEIVGSFWEDIEHGKAVLRAHAPEGDDEDNQDA